jgi:hypothetical protein
VKELDFDELDKAVNSLMAGVSSTPTPPDDSKEKTLTIGSSQPTPASAAPSLMPTPSPSPSASVPVSTRKTTPPSARPTNAQTAPASRRAGRFMDVVHPSSDMKKPEPTRPVSREGAVLEPVTPVAKDTPPAVETPAEKPSVPAETTTAPKSDWPDPLEMANFSDKKDETSLPSESVGKSEAEETALPESDKDDMDTPLVSPFLAGTKVEKRPLGANATAGADETDAALPMTTDEQLPATAEDTKSILPEELHSDLVAIESDTADIKPVEEIPEVSDAAKEKKESKRPVWNKPDTENETAKERSVPTGPVSIPQQYKEEPSSGNQENGAIYDTDTYHQPLAHPAKQKSGWMWVVWIVLILIIGAGAGAAVYFLKFV